jgi:hypothetical protein
VGCCLTEDSFKELRTAYLMVENERSGGVSPKVFPFPGIGEVGTAMSTSKLKLPSIIAQNFTV